MYEIRYVAAMRFNPRGEVIEQLTTIVNDGDEEALERVRQEVESMGWESCFYQLRVWVSSTHGDKVSNGWDLYRFHDVAD